MTNTQARPPTPVEYWPVHSQRSSLSDHSCLFAGCSVLICDPCANSTQPTPGGQMMTVMTKSKLSFGQTGMDRSGTCLPGWPHGCLSATAVFFDGIRFPNMFAFQRLNSGDAEKMIRLEALVCVETGQMDTHKYAHAWSVTQPTTQWPLIPPFCLLCHSPGPELANTFV